jgi:hypothetical protein
LSSAPRAEPTAGQRPLGLRIASYPNVSFVPPPETIFLLQRVLLRPPTRGLHRTRFPAKAWPIKVVQIVLPRNTDSLVAKESVLFQPATSKFMLLTHVAVNKKKHFFGFRLHSVPFETQKSQTGTESGANFVFATFFRRKPVALSAHSGLDSSFV